LQRSCETQTSLYVVNGKLERAFYVTPSTPSSRFEALYSALRKSSLNFR